MAGLNFMESPLITEEVRNQNESVQKSISSIDRKTEVVSGFIVTTMGFVISQNTFLEIMLSTNLALIGLFLLGLSLLVVSLIFAYLSYKSRFIIIGPNIHNLSREFTNNHVVSIGVSMPGETLDSKMNRQLLNEGLVGTLERNIAVLKIKNRNLTHTFFLFGLGLLTMVFAKFLYFLVSN